MATVVQIRRGNTAGIAGYVGPAGEIIFNTSTGRLHVQDGVTVGGRIIALLSDTGGGGDGDMTKAVYDPRNVLADVFSMASMSEAPDALILTDEERDKLASVAVGATQNSSDEYLLALENSTGVLPQARVTGLTAALNSKQGTNQKNVANGYAGLDVDGKLLPSTLPDLAITQTYVVATQTAMLALTCQQGDVAVRTDQNKTYILAEQPPSALGNWVELLTPTTGVISVAGLVGAITASQLKTALALDQVANVAPADMPISDDVQLALDGKWGNTTTSIDYGTLGD